MSSLHANVGRLIRVGIALLLTASAVAKIVAPQQVPDGPTWLALVHFAVAVGEFALAGWALCGLFPSACHLSCVTLFSAFGGYSLSVIMWREVSCGCFGRFQVSPLLVLAIDLAALASLVLPWSRTSFSKLETSGVSHSGRGLFSLIGATFLISVCCSSAIRHYSPTTTVDLTSPSLAAARGTVLPFGRCVESRGSILAGHWLLVIHRSDCERCRANLASLQPEIVQILERDDRLRLGTIDVAAPRDFQPEVLRDLGGRTIPWNRTCVARTARTPVLLLVSNGNVVDVLPSLLTDDSHLANN